MPSLIRWAYNPDLAKVGTEELVDDETSSRAVKNGWGVVVKDSDAPQIPDTGEAPPPPPEEHHDEAGSA